MRTIRTLDGSLGYHNNTFSSELVRINILTKNYILWANNLLYFYVHKFVSIDLKGISQENTSSCPQINFFPLLIKVESKAKLSITLKCICVSLVWNNNSKWVLWAMTDEGVLFIKYITIMIKYFKLSSLWNFRTLKYSRSIDVFSLPFHFALMNEKVERKHQ